MPCPNASNATPDERGTLQRAQERLVKQVIGDPECGAFFGSSFVVRSFLEGIRYQFLPGRSNIDGARHEPGYVGIYGAPGLFFQEGGGAWRDIWGPSPKPLEGEDWQGSMVGHELAHEMRIIENDSRNVFGPFSPHMSLANDFLVSNRCFGFGR